MRAARTKYSTPKVHPHEVVAAEAIGSPDLVDRAPVRETARRRDHLRSRRLSPRAGSSPTGIAIGWPVANIRHRFGGYLRAARATDIRDALVTHRRHVPMTAETSMWAASSAPDGEGRRESAGSVPVHARRSPTRRRPVTRSMV